MSSVSGDTDTLREVLQYAIYSLEVAEKFHDAAAVMALSNIVTIIERRHLAHTCPVSDSTRIRW